MGFQKRKHLNKNTKGIDFICAVLNARELRGCVRSPGSWKLVALLLDWSRGGVVQKCEFLPLGRAAW